MHAVLVPVYLLLITPITSSWWAAGSQVVMDPHQMCKKSRRLKGKMADICRNETILLNQISKGIKMGQDECQFLFKNRRWNCTTSKRSMKKVLIRDTRETAFVNALTAAGITFSVTRACSMGLLINCSCESKKSCEKKTEKVKSVNNVPMTAPAGDWKWSGGGDNINYGLRKSKDFMDTRYKKMSDMKTLVKLHNYAAGRMAIKKHMRTECKCHGLSGSCNLRTCWKKMPKFQEVGSRLYKHFESATEVIAGNDGRSFIPNGATIKSPTREDLVYSEKYLPLQFCMPNSTVGSLGTQGRECDPKSDSENGCDQLCCGRGYTKKSVKETVNCKCHFSWCCEVKCELCENNYILTTCL